MASDYLREPFSVTVDTKGVNFRDERDVKATYVRLQHAAVAACNSGFDRNLAAQSSDAKCARRTLDKAVLQLNQPMLSALHNGKPATGADYASLQSR